MKPLETHVVAGTTRGQQGHIVVVGRLELRNQVHVEEPHPIREHAERKSSTDRAAR